MVHLELPYKQRTRWYRFWEMVPALLSYSALAFVIILSIISPLAASIYILIVICALFVRMVMIMNSSIRGHRLMDRAMKIDWSARLRDLEDPEAAYQRYQSVTHGDSLVHADHLRLIAADPASYPKPSSLHHVVIVTAYNEPIEVIEPTIQSLVKTTYDKSQMTIIFAYEQRGGEGVAKTASVLKKRYAKDFYAFETVMHPSDLPGEIIGKGPNITYAGEYLKGFLRKKAINPHNVIVTTLDCDNKPYPSYFDYVAYEYIVHDDRKHVSFQPLSLYFGNIWSAPAAMRVIAINNTFWTIITSVRPHMLRNFASHSQPYEALVEMGFWSKRSIVEDGHQYWRSYFFFSGDYQVIPILVPIYQDAVTAGSLRATSVAQFKQLRRWSYGASDVPYVAVRLFSKERTVPLLGGVARFIRLLDSHVSLATLSLIVALGGWVPLLFSPNGSHNIVAHNLPGVVGIIQQIAMLGLLVTIFLSLKMLPPRPPHIPRWRTIGMYLQWLLMPLVTIFYSGFAALNAQTHLLFGRYLDTFDLTEKTADTSTRTTK